jgi:hypothetical protein
MKTINEVASMGGKARAKKYSKAKLKEWALKGVEARRKKRKKLSTGILASK